MVLCFFCVCVPLQMYFDIVPMLLTSSLGLSSFIFFLVMWPRKPAWILAAALFAAGSSRGMSMMSSSCGWVHPSYSSDKTQSAILAMTTWQKNTYSSLSRSTPKCQRTFTLCNTTGDQSLSRTPSVKWLQTAEQVSVELTKKNPVSSCKNSKDCPRFLFNPVTMERLFRLL